MLLLPCPVIKPRLNGWLIQTRGSFCWELWSQLRSEPLGAHGLALLQRTQLWLAGGGQTLVAISVPPGGHSGLVGKLKGPQPDFFLGRVLASNPTEILAGDGAGLA